MTEQDNRQYAATLLNRADQPFDVRDLAMVAKVVELVERDVAALASIPAPAAAQIFNGDHRPKAEGN